MSKGKPTFYQEIENNPSNIMLWAGITEEHASGPYFYEVSVAQVTYLEMLND